MNTNLYLGILITALSIGSAILVFSSGMSRIRKAIIIISFLITGFVSYRALNSVYGYPANIQKSFKEILVLGHYINKPDKVIYLWLKDKEGPPRSYAVPYNPRLANTLNKQRGKYKGKPYKVEIKGKANHTNPFTKIVEDIKIKTKIPVLPPKRDRIR